MKFQMISLRWFGYLFLGMVLITVRRRYNNSHLCAMYYLVYVIRKQWSFRKGSRFTHTCDVNLCNICRAFLARCSIRSWDKRISRIQNWFSKVFLFKDINRKYFYLGACLRPMTDQVMLVSKNHSERRIINQLIDLGHLLGIWIFGCSLFYKREL